MVSRWRLDKVDAHTDGHKITPTGPSPLTNGSFTSASRAIIIAGMQKARVFPEPVNAMPIISLPENLIQKLANSPINGNNTYAVGIPCS